MFLNAMKFGTYIKFLQQMKFFTFPAKYLNIRRVICSNDDIPINPVAVFFVNC